MTSAQSLPGGDGADGRPALKMDGVSASYGPYRALFGVSLTVPHGGAVALLGSNGAGKSTVARVVSGLLPATRGRIEVGGVNVTNQPAYRVARAGVAHVVEGRGIFSHLTVEENLALGFRQRVGRAQVAESLSRAYEAFPALGRRRRQAGGTLSGGEQRMLSLAKVLVVAPRLLIADELSLGLAPSVIETVYSSLRRIHETGTALLVVEQRVDRAVELASGATVLDHGSVVFQGPARDAAAAMEKVIGARALPS